MVQSKLGNSKQVLTDEKKIDILIKERYELKSIGLEFQKAMRNSFFTFLTVLVSLGTVYLEKRIIPDDQVRTYVLFFLSQAEVVLAFFALTQLTVVSSTSTYAKMLEDLINKLNNEPLLYFESVAMQRLVNSKRASHFWSMAGMIMLLLVFFFWCMKVTLEEVGALWFQVLASFEVAWILICVVTWFYEMRNGTSMLSKRLREYENSLSKSRQK